ncbi:hypothetical protein Aduo_008311 [Ancylostoma duodenale]
MFDAKAYLDNLFKKSRRTLSERDVQSILEDHHRTTGELLLSSHFLDEECIQLRLEMIDGQSGSRKATYMKACDWIVKAVTTKERMNAIRRDICTLWKVYELLIDGEHATEESQSRFIQKKRADPRSISRTTSYSVLTAEIQHLHSRISDFYQSMTNFTANGIVEENERDISAIEERLEKKMEVLFQKNEKILETLMTNMQDRLSKIEEKVEIQSRPLTTTEITEKLDNACKKLDEKIEVAIESGIQTLLTVKKMKKTMEESEMQDHLDVEKDCNQNFLHQEKQKKHAETGEKTPHSKRINIPQKTAEVAQEPQVKRSRTITPPPTTPQNKNYVISEIERLEKKLSTLSKCPPRFFRNEKFTVYMKNNEVGSCAFCEEEGAHPSDGCPRIRVVDARRKALARMGKCVYCLGFCPKPCPYRTECRYCKSTYHNTAICHLPQERKEIMEKIRKLKNQVAEVGQGADQPARVTYANQ